MKFTSTLSALALVATASAAAVTVNKKFTPVASSSDGKFDEAKIRKVDEHAFVFEVGGDNGNEVSLTLVNDAYLVDQDGIGIYVDPSTGNFGNVNSDQQPSSYFTIDDDILALNGNSKWKACPSGENQYSFAQIDCQGGTELEVKVTDLQDA